MKTSVIEVHDMLSVLTVDEVETRIGGITGVESATVNRAYPVSSQSPKHYSTLQAHIFIT